MPATAALPRSTGTGETTNAAVSSSTAQGPDQTCPSTAIAVQVGLECLGPDGCLSARARGQSGQYYASPESDELSLGNLSQMASISPAAEVLTSIPLCFRP